MKKNFKGTKGITLIALVLTIIVLLILAGVTVATLTGENGILSQAQGAKDSTERAGEKEKIQLEVLGSYETDGSISLKKLKENIANNIKEASHNNATSFPLIVTYTATGHAYKVESDGTVSKNIGLSLDKEQITFIVVNGTVQSPTTEKITAILQGITGTVNWTSDDENEEVISLSINENEVTITANGIGNAKVTASLDGEEPVTCNIIVKELQTVTINTAVSPTNTGTAEINEEAPYIEGTTVTIIPTANTGYKFKEWQDESENKYVYTEENNGQYTGITVAKNGALTYTVSTAKTFTAIFEEKKVGFKNPDYNNPKGISYYGRQVLTGVTSVNNVPIEDNWRIFFADKDFVYLIYGYFYPGEVTIGNETKNVQTSTTEIELNPTSRYTYGVSGTDRLNLLKYLKNNSSYTVSYANKDAFAPSESYDSWINLASSFSSGNALAKKVVAVQGSPNIEMWVASWNTQQSNDETRLKAEWVSADTYGYNIMLKSETSNSQHSKKINNTNTLYYPYSASQSSVAHGYWLASPGEEGINYMCGVSPGAITCSLGQGLDNFCARPVVSIPISDFNANQNDITIE